MRLWGKGALQNRFITMARCPYGALLQLWGKTLKNRGPFLYLGLLQLI